MLLADYKSRGESFLQELVELQDGHLKGKVLEHLAKSMLQEASLFDELEDVWLWTEWPEAQSIDDGIDLVARTRGGELWAIQAKCYGREHRSLCKSDVDSFLARSSTSQFAHRLIISTTQDISKNLARHISALNGDPGVAGISVVDLPAMIDLDYGWPKSVQDFLEGKRDPFQKETLRPRQHQIEAIEDVLSGFEDHDRGQLVMACGTGKTLTSLWIAEDLQAEAILVAAPSLSLLAQLVGEWRKHFPRFEGMAVCSDASISSRSEDELALASSSLQMPVTTDPELIRAFLLRANDRYPHIIFSTYHSVDRISSALSGAEFTFDLAICDEAHRLAGSGTIGKEILTDIPATRRLFMTATPKIITKQVQDEAEGLVSMDNKELFGPQFHHLSFGESIERKLLVDYEIYVVAVKDDKTKELLQQRSFVDLSSKDKKNHLVDAATTAKTESLRQLMAKKSLRRSLAFYSSIKEARKGAEIFGDISNLEAELVTGADPVGQRKKALARLSEGATNIITNVRCLSEGIDVPAIDAVAFMHPVKSVVDVVQAVGRAMRVADDKDRGYILIPVFIEEGDNADLEISESSFAELWSVVAALSANDERLQVKINEIRSGLGAAPGGLFNIVGDSSIDISKAKLKDLQDSLGLRVAQKLSLSWWERFGTLSRFLEKERRMPLYSESVAFNGKEDYIGRWVAAQQANYKNGVLEQERVEALDSLPLWSWDKEDYNQIQWDRKLRLLRQFVQENGRLPVQGDTIEDVAIGNWTSSQRGLYRRGGLSKERAQSLESVPNWHWGHGSLWMRRFSLLATFVEKQGRMPTAKETLTYDNKEIPIGNWVLSQKARYKQGVLGSEKIALLESLPGWDWGKKGSRAYSWDERFQQLEDFIARNGRLPRHKEKIEVDGTKVDIGDWALVQRGKYKKGDLGQERVKKLESLPGWKWVLQEYSDWESAFAAYKQRCEEVGFAWVAGPKATEREFIEVDGRQVHLNQWVAHQKKLARNNQEKVKKFESLPGWSWDLRQAEQLAYPLALEMYQCLYGATPDPQYAVRGLPLGQWFARTQLEERVAAIEELVQGQGKSAYLIAMGDEQFHWLRQEAILTKLPSHQLQRRIESLPGWNQLLSYHQGLLRIVNDFGYRLDPETYRQNPQMLDQFRIDLLQFMKSRRYLSAKEVNATLLKWGIGEDARSLEEIAIKIGESRERTRQMIVETEKILRTDPEIGQILPQNPSLLSA